MNYVETPNLLAALGPQPLWLYYQCIPVWEESESLFVVSWATLDATAIEDLELIFGKPVRQIGMGEREELLTLIRTHALDQPISELH